MQTNSLASQLRRCLNAAFSSEVSGPRRSRRTRSASQVESRFFVEVNTLEQRILLAADLGDAPSPYPVTLAENGAQHTTTGPTLGTNRDSEANGAHSATANADDTTGVPDDEDGVTFGVIRAGQLGATVTVNVQNAPSGAKLDAWIDFDQDGSWGGPFEQIASNLAMVNGNNTVSFDVPSWALDGTTFGRFRLSTAGNSGVTGLAANGEVEDHAISITSPDATNGDFGTQLVISNISQEPVSSVSADFDGDGDMDIVSAFGTSNLISWFENNGAEIFTPHTITATGRGVVSLVAADLDGDGDVDVVAALTPHVSSVERQRFEWYENNGSGGFTPHTIAASTGPSPVPLSPFVADMDRDGDMDILGGQYAPQIAWYKNDGNQNFTRHTISEGMGDGQDGVSVVANDLDGDGDMDAIAALSNGGVSWFENNGSQVFTAHMISAAPTSSASLQDFRSVFAADIDGDQDIDIAAAGQDAGPGDDGQVVWYENNGSQVFTLRVLSNAALGANSVFVADMNGDGRADVLAASTLDSKVRWFRNDGGGVFTEKLVYSKGDNIADYTYTVFASDIDSDGDLDVLSSILGDNKVVWFPNLNGLDFGDAPTGYPVTLAENGARHLVGGPFFGTKRDTESDGTHSTMADVDDLTGVDDEDGVRFSEFLSQSPRGNVEILASGFGKLDAWLDLNQDGDWLDAGEKIINSANISSGNNFYGFDTPNSPVSGVMFARFRVSTVGSPDPTGQAADGEVEDLQVFVQPPKPVITGPVTPTSSQRPVMTWTAVPGVTTYNVNVTNRSTNTDDYNLATVTGTSYTPTVDFGIGSYSYTVQSVGTPGGPPSYPSLSYLFHIKAPVTGLQTAAVQTNVRPTLTWNALLGSVRYDVWIDNLTTNQEQFVRDQNVSTTSFTPAIDLPFGNYRAYVRGIPDNSGQYPGAWSAALNFSIVQLPAPVVTQGQNSTFDRTPTFAWNAVSGAAKYDVVIRNLKNGQTVVEARNIAGTSYTQPTPLPDGPYAWWVSAITSANARGVWTDQMDIYIGGKTIVLTPTGSSSDTTPTFSWKPVDGAVRYELWVDRQNPWVQKAVYQTNLVTTSFTSGALPAGTYRTWVRAVSASNEFSPWSVPIDFTITSSDAALDVFPVNPAEDDVVDGVLRSLFDRSEFVRVMPQSYTPPVTTEPASDRGAEVQIVLVEADGASASADECIDAFIEKWMLNPMDEV